MKKIIVWVATNKIGSRCETSFEVEDETTDEEIDEIAQEMMWEMVEWDWRKEDA